MGEKGYDQEAVAAGEQAFENGNRVPEENLQLAETILLNGGPSEDVPGEPGTTRNFWEIWEMRLKDRQYRIWRTYDEPTWPPMFQGEFPAKKKRKRKAPPE